MARAPARTKRGDLRLIVPPETMDKLRSRATVEDRDIRQQALAYIKRGLAADEFAEKPILR